MEIQNIQYSYGILVCFLQVTLKENDIGQLYVFVQTDLYRYTSDIDSSNNMLKASDVVEAKLTPPPDLRVDTIAMPSSSYSGKSC